MKSITVILLAFFLNLTIPANAHEVRPGYLEIIEIEPSKFSIFWKIPARGEAALALRVRLPGNCRQRGEAMEINDGVASIRRWTVICDGGLKGAAILIEGLETTFTDVLARLTWMDGSAQTVRPTPAAPEFLVSGPSSFLEVATTYFWIGVEHILFGFDHLLFVLILLILVRGLRPILVTVTAFTVSHSLSLAAATLGLIHVPSKPVETAIALSIVLVAAEVVRNQGEGRIKEYRMPWLIAFLFGFVHGLGFASALIETGLPQYAITTALLFFNIGVEAGQLLFIATALVGWAVVRQLFANAPPMWLWRVPTYAIGIIASFWLFDRLAGFHI